MVIQFGMVITEGGLPITSYEFSSGGIEINEVLFSGFISAIQPFLKDIKEARHQKRTGEIKNGDITILYYHANKAIGVLVGNNFNEQIRDTLIDIIDLFVSQIYHLDDFYHLEDQSLQDAISLLHRNLRWSFGPDALNDFLIPKLNGEIPKSDDEIRNSFIELINGSRSFKEISEVLGMKWINLLDYAAQLKETDLITVGLSYSKEQIFEVTPFGIDMIFKRQDVPISLREKWDAHILPIISEFKMEWSFDEVKRILSKHIKKLGEDEFYNIMRELLSHGIITPLPRDYELGKFLQEYSLEFVKIVKKKIGKTGLNFYMKRVEEAGYIRSLMPDFENNRLHTIDKFYALLKDMGKEEKIKFVEDYIDPVRSAMIDIAAFAGEKVIGKTYKILFDRLYDKFQNLIDDYLLHEIVFLPLVRM